MNDTQHYQHVQATILAGMLANPNLVHSPRHLDDFVHRLENRAKELAGRICNPTPKACDACGSTTPPLHEQVDGLLICDPCIDRHTGRVLNR